MMWQTTMNPATRRLIRVSEADAEQTAIIFDTLLGDNLPARKDFIAKYAAQYIDRADI
jgi:DNA gyrase subunit B